MNHSGSSISRSGFLRRSGAMVALTVVGGGALLSEDRAIAANSSAAPNGDLRPLDPITAMLDVMDRFPLVAITERHTLQEWHDVMTALLFYPALPGRINDIVVEFGNAHYQGVADTFVLAGRPVSNSKLRDIWRQVGDPTWNAPVYEQFFHSVRAVNLRLPPSRRIRVLLGQPPVTMDQVLAHPQDRHLSAAFVDPMDAHYAAVAEREVMQKRRRALLTAGGGHMLRGLHKDGDPRQLNAVSRLAQQHPGKIFVIDLLILPPGPHRDSAAQRVAATVARWPRPALAHLAGTWLGAVTQSGNWVNSMAYRAVDATAARYGAQADAVLYLGPGERLTGSRPDPAMYHWGAYPEQLRRLSPIVSRVFGEQVDIVNMGLQMAQAGPSWFSGI